MVRVVIVAARMAVTSGRVFRLPPVGYGRDRPGVVNVLAPSTDVAAVEAAASRVTVVEFSTPARDRALIDAR